MKQIKVQELHHIEWNEGSVANKLGSVDIVYRNGERERYEGDDLRWVVPQIKDYSGSHGNNLLSENL